MKRLLRAAIESVVLSDLRKAFHRVWDAGISVDLDPHRPVVLYANHHSFFDGHLVWLVARQSMTRQTMTWMQEWHRFPFLRAAGALPFPDDDSPARSSTMRETKRRFTENPRSALILFPEGAMHPAEEGILPFSDGRLERLSRIFPQALWCPVAIHSSWREGDRPDAFLATGSVQDQIYGDEDERLRRLLGEMPARSLRPSSLLLTGRASANERWDFRFLAPLFRRF